MVTFFATSDSTLPIGKTPEFTTRRKDPKHGSTEDTRVTHCHLVQQLSFDSTQLSLYVRLGACVVKHTHIQTAMHMVNGPDDATWQLQ